MRKITVLIECFLIHILSLFIFAETSCPQVHAPTVDVSIIHEAEHAIKRGIDFLDSTRQPNGSWSHYPAITALVVTAMLGCPDNLADLFDLEVQRGLTFILSHAKPDGGIYPEKEMMRCYNTAICLVALIEAKDPAYDDVIYHARNYLISLQADERIGYTSVDSLYGGIGYGGDERPDISNLQIALEALARSESHEKTSEGDLKIVEGLISASGNRPYYEKAIVFLTRSQNLKSTNPYSWAGNDGGFMYYPGNSKAGGTRSYGGMTYAGLKSFIYARVDKNDERVKAAYRWITNNYTVTENPGIGDNGLFYYYHTMSKALNIYEVDFVKTTDGQEHNWREDLIRHLVSIQEENGSWVNKNARWWENNRDLVTAYSIMTLINAGWPSQ